MTGAKVGIQRVEWTDNLCECDPETWHFLLGMGEFSWETHGGQDGKSLCVCVCVGDRRIGVEKSFIRLWAMVWEKDFWLGSGQEVGSWKERFCCCAAALKRLMFPGHCKTKTNKKKEAMLVFVCFVVGVFWLIFFFVCLFLFFFWSRKEKGLWVLQGRSETCGMDDACCYAGGKRMRLLKFLGEEKVSEDLGSRTENKDHRRIHECFGLKENNQVPPSLWRGQWIGIWHPE